MLSTETNIRFYTNPKMIKLPIGIQSEVMSIFEDVLSGVKGDNPDATISELLSTVPESIPAEFAEPNTELAESTGTIPGYVEPTAGFAGF